MNCNTNNAKSQVVCPIPLSNLELAPVLLFSNEADQTTLDSKNEAELLLDLILKEDGIAAMPSASTSPPFFNGSPPRRPTNPIIHDVRFANYGKQFTCLSSSPSATTSASAPASPSCKAILPGQKTKAPARVEGFDCPNFSSD